MITRRRIGIGIAVVGIGLFGGIVAQKSFLATTPRLAPRRPIIKQGPHARHPFLQWVDMTSQQHGWALNRSDRLLVTWNGGHTWYRTPAVDVTNGPSNTWNATHIQGFYSLNQHDAWVSSTEGIPSSATKRSLLTTYTLYRTTTGGRTWTKLHAPGVGWVDFLTPQRGWFLTFEGVAMGNYPSDLYVTTNGGRRWLRVTATFSESPSGISYAPHIAPNPSNARYITTDLKKGLVFQSAARGWIASVNTNYFGSQRSPVISRTSNGGRSWRWTMFPHEPLPNPTVSNPPQFFPATGRHGLIPLQNSPLAVSGNLAPIQQVVWYQTLDGGNRWTRTGQIVRSTPFSGDVSFVSVSDGWVLWSDRSQHLWHTVNGGHTWTTWVIRAPDHPGVRFAGIDFLTVHCGWAVSVRGQLWSTIDGGKIWTPVVPRNS